MTEIPAPVASPKANALLEGPILRSLLSLAVPIALANVLQAAYQLIDAFWVGRLGGAAIAAVSISFPVMFLMIALGIAATAFNGIASQKARELFEKPPSVPSEVSGIRYVIFQLRIGFLIATLGALSTGIWRFTI